MPVLQKHCTRLDEIETHSTAFPFFDRLVLVPEDCKALFLDNAVNEHPADGVQDDPLRWLGILQAQSAFFLSILPAFTVEMSSTGPKVDLRQAKRGSFAWFKILVFISHAPRRTALTWIGLLLQMLLLCGRFSRKSLSQKDGAGEGNRTLCYLVRLRATSCNLLRASRIQPDGIRL